MEILFPFTGTHHLEIGERYEVHTAKRFVERTLKRYRNVRDNLCTADLFLTSHFRDRSSFVRSEYIPATPRMHLLCCSPLLLHGEYCGINEPKDAEFPICADRDSPAMSTALELPPLFADNEMTIEDMQTCIGFAQQRYIGNRIERNCSQGR